MRVCEKGNGDTSRGYDRQLSATLSDTVPGLLVLVQAWHTHSTHTTRHSLHDLLLTLLSDLFIGAPLFLSHHACGEPPPSRLQSSAVPGPCGAAALR